MIQNYKQLCRVNRNFIKFLSRNVKTKADQNKNFTASINLPRTGFPARLNPAQRAEAEQLINAVRIIQKRLESNLFYNKYFRSA